MQNIKNQISQIVDNGTFRRVYTIGTIGLGAWFAWKDIQTCPWMQCWNTGGDDKVDVEKTKCTVAKCYPHILHFSILDNGCGLAYQNFFGHDEESWNNHFKSTLIQFMLLCPFLAAQQKKYKICPFAILCVSWYWQCKGWSWVFKALFKKW